MAEVQTYKEGRAGAGGGGEPYHCNVFQFQTRQGFSLQKVYICSRFKTRGLWFWEKVFPSRKACLIQVLTVTVRLDRLCGKGCGWKSVFLCSRTWDLRASISTQQHARTSYSRTPSALAPLFAG